MATPFLIMSPLFGLVPLSYTATCGALGGLLIPLVARKRWVLWSGTVALALSIAFLGALNPPKSALRQRYENALAEGDVQTVREALDQGIAIRELPGPRENTFVPDLTLAVMGGSVDSVKLLLDRGADPNALGAAGSPLELAAGSGNLKIARLLISRGAKVTGQRPFMHYAEGSPLQTAVYSGNPRMVRLLLHYCPPHSDELRDVVGHPLSEWARECGKAEIAGLLEAHAGKADRAALPGKRLESHSSWATSNRSHTRASLPITSSIGARPHAW